MAVLLRKRVGIRSGNPLRFSARDLCFAWLMATLFSGIPSTVHALVVGTDPLEATRAAGAMLLPTVAALSLWPQFADHLAWGALLGATLQLRSRGCHGAADEH
jgi:hypothetical protein